MKHTEKKAKKARALLRFFLYAFSGFLFALPTAIPCLWLIGWIAPVPVLYLELYSKDKNDSYLLAYCRGMSFFVFFGICVFYWFIELYPLDFLGFEKGEAICIIILASIGIPLLQAVASSFIFILLRIVKKRGFSKKHPVISAAFAAGAFSLGEFYHTLFWFGVPWGKAAVGQVGCLANVQSASLFGSYFITFLMIFTSSLIAASLKRKYGKRRILLSALALAVFLSNFIFGTVRCAVIEKRSTENTVTVAAIQGNVYFESKWSNKTRYILDTYSSLSKEASRDGAELIIWPETARPYDISENDFMLDYFTDCASECGCEILVTAFESEGDDLYNTARLAKKDLTVDDTVYKKRHLVPFGEYIPLKNLVSAVYPPLLHLSSAIDEMTPGEESAVIETEDGSLGVLICFDSIYDELCRESVRDGAGLIAVSTNDSWFSGSSALSSHNAHSQLRAVENGRFVIRAANTGISSVISPSGEIVESLGDNEKGYITADVRYINDTTLYTRTGNAFLVFCAALVACVMEKRNDDSHNKGI